MTTTSKVCTSILTGLLCVFTNLNLFASTINANPIVDLFENIHTGTDKKGLVEDAVYFNLNKTVLSQIQQQKLETMALQIPFGATKKLEVQLKKVNFLAADFRLSVQKRDLHNTLSYSPGLFYRGIIPGVKDALVTINFFEGQVTGILSLYGENYNLGPYQKGANDLFVLYKERNLNASNPFACATEDPSELTINREPKSNGRANNKVRVYIECDYHLFVTNGSDISKTTNFATGLFNVISAIYANDDINLEVSEIKVWNTPDPYPTTSAKVARDAFGASLNGQFNGDIAHLLSNYKVNGTVPNGGSANIDALCDKEKAVGYTNITTSYNNYPTYSWTAYAVTHEIGHNLGSPHTHSCLWPTGPIDNCWCPEGDCAQGPEPASSGGTIMSYCHLNPQWTNDCDLSEANPGINLANGFGQLPSSLIRERIANANCLGSEGNGNNGSGNVFQASATVTPETCNQKNGAITLTVSFGQTPYQYAWSNGSTTRDLNNLSAGIYSCIIIDASGKTTTIEGIVKGSASFRADAGANQSINCLNPIVSLDGSNSTSGFAYNYEWTKLGGSIFGNAQKAVISISEPGTYILAVRNGDTQCIKKDTVYVTEDFSKPSIRLSSEAITCENNGVYIKINTSTSISAYQWTGPDGYSSTEKSPKVNTTGTYKLIAIGTNGCVSEKTINISGSNAGQAIIAEGGQITCENATVQLQLTTDASEATYLWSGPNSFESTLKNPIVTQAGDYEVTMTTATGCISQSSATVTTRLKAPSIDLEGGIITCSQPTIQLKARVFLEEVKYSWTGPNNFQSSEQNPTVTQAGTYQVMVETASGCTNQRSILVLDETTIPTISLEGGVITCIHPTIQLKANTIANAQYEWTGPNNFSSAHQNPFVDESGVYQLTITTSNGCSNQSSITVTKDTASPEISVKGGTINCVRSTITFQVNTNAVDLSYQWTGPNGFNTDEKTPTVALAGDYQLTVQSSTGCESIINVLVEEDKRLPDFAIKGDHITCQQTKVTLEGLSNEVLIAYQWEKEKELIGDKESIEIAAGGIYQLTTTGENGCTNTKSFTIEEQISLPLFEVKTTDLTCTNPSTTINVVHENEDLDFQWTGPNNFNATLASPTVNTPGTYTLVVKNDKGCSNEVSVSINQIATSTINIATPIVLSCAAETVLIDASTSILTPNARIEWTTSDGHILTKEPQLIIEVDTPGTYVLTIRDLETECVVFETVTVTKMPTISAKIENERTLTCKQSALNLTAGGNGYSDHTIFNWVTDNGNITSNRQQKEITVDAPGFYTLFVTDTLTGCTDATFTRVDRMEQPTVKIEIPQPITCLQPTITLNGSASILNTTSVVEWTRNGQRILDSHSFFLNVNTAGIYTMTIVDTLNGCQASGEMEVLEHQAPIVSIAQTQQDFCAKKEGSIALNINASQAYQIEWSNGATTASIADLAEGKYTATITDAFGCQSVISQSIEASKPVSLGNVNISPITCHDAANGNITLALKDGNLPYETIWSNGETDLSIDELAAGTHTLEVVDAKGCVENFDFIMAAPKALEAEVKVMGKDVLIEVEGGTPDYNFTWNNGETGNFATQLPSGKQEVMIEDANGCSISKSFVIDQTTPIKEIKEQALAIKVYPNPTSDYFMISKQLKHSSSIQLAVFTANGALVTTATTFGNYIDEKIITTDWKAGTYFLQVATSEGISTNKIEVIKK